MSESSAFLSIDWGFLDNVQGVVLIGRVDGKPMAVIELRPRLGFRLTECGSGRTTVFQSLDEAKLAAALPGSWRFEQNSQGARQNA